MSEFICINCGQCCTIVPISNTDWDNIVTAVGDIGFANIEHLMKQKRDSMTCIFRDTFYNKCAIHEHRPLICRLQGTQEGLPCPNMPRYGKGDDGKVALYREFGEKNEYFKGILSDSIGWKEILEVVRRKEENNA